MVKKGGELRTLTLLDRGCFIIKLEAGEIIEVTAEGNELGERPGITITQVHLQMPDMRC